jgi:hypothetical protein
MAESMYNDKLVLSVRSRLWHYFRFVYTKRAVFLAN